MERSITRRKTRFVLFKLNVISAHNSHFAGGKHAFVSMASTLAAEGFDVHVVSVASRGKVLVHAGMAGLLPKLSFSQPGAVCWRETQQLHYHIILEDDPAPGGNPAGAKKVGLSLNTLAATTAYVRNLVGQAPAAASNAALRPDEYNNSSNSADSSSAAAPTSWLIIDADESQKALETTSSSLAAATPSTSTTTLFEALLHTAPKRRCVALVQNVHFLPLGPSGTGPRSPSLLAAWARLGGVVAVSDFVAGYLREHWPVPAEGAATGQASGTVVRPPQAEGTPCGGTEASAGTGEPVGYTIGGPPQKSAPGTSQQGATASVQPEGDRRGSGGEADVSKEPPPPQQQQQQAHMATVPLSQEERAPFAAGTMSLGRQRVHVVPLATWRVFGRPPFPDLAATAKPLLQAWRAAARGDGRLQLSSPPAGLEPERVGEAGACSAGPTDVEGTPLLSAGPPPPTQAAPRAVDVAVLKLTPEKGCSIVVELARRLGGRGVRFRVVAGDPAVSAVLAPLVAAGAVQLWEPQPDVTRVLSGCVAVLAPSLWLEAWGMVVTEALLRGLPVVVSDLGGLPEAGMRLCPAVPVDPIRIPRDSAGVPDWSAREYPKQDIGAWESALLALLLGPGGPSDSSRQDGSQGHKDKGDGRVHDSGSAAAAVCESDPRDTWEQLSVAGRRAALCHIGCAGEYLEEFLAWLEAL